jgi:hypothetical protein
MLIWFTVRSLFDFAIKMFVRSVRRIMTNIASSWSFCSLAGTCWLVCSCCHSVSSYRYTKCSSRPPLLVSNCSHSIDVSLLSLFSGYSRYSDYNTSVPFVQWIPGFFHGEKRLGRDVELLIPSSAKVKNDWIYTTTAWTRYVTCCILQSIAVI